MFLKIQKLLITRAKLIAGQDYESSVPSLVEVQQAWSSLYYHANICLIWDDSISDFG